jgi:hypothetical protein
MPLGRSFRLIFAAILSAMALAALGGCLMPERAKAPTLPTATRPAVVLGYSAAWTDGSYPPSAYDYASLTHIARSFLNPHPDGHITDSAGFWNDDLERRAHEHGVKLLASIGGAAPDANHWLSMARDKPALERFFSELDGTRPVCGRTARAAMQRMPPRHPARDDRGAHRHAPPVQAQARERFRRTPEVGLPFARARREEAAFPHGQKRFGEHLEAHEQVVGRRDPGNLGEALVAAIGRRARELVVAGPPGGDRERAAHREGGCRFTDGIADLERHPRPFDRLAVIALPERRDGETAGAPALLELVAGRLRAVAQ